MTPRTNLLYWSESSDETKLQLEVTEKRGRYFLSNTAEYHPTNLNVFYFVDWDLLGEQKQPKPLREVEVEPYRLYLVHLYEMTKPYTLWDFWRNDDPHKGCEMAFLWVEGQGVRTTVRRSPETTGLRSWPMICIKPER